MRKCKLVVISRCSDCPVEGCEHRVRAGSIPAECALEDVPQPLDNFKCNVCRAVFAQVPMERPYCPVCGTRDVSKLITAKEIN